MLKKLVSDTIILRRIGTNLRRMRLAAELSQTEIGRAIGISYQQVQKYERGQDRLSGIALYKLCIFFDCTLEDFFS